MQVAPLLATWLKSVVERDLVAEGANYKGLPSSVADAWYKAFKGH
ncbi:hypothetical protein CASFOL_040155 [Castilleja foliolosa]|uniref:Uncharacterized protein n=1 Tax=Castilleja foliolosa TaxID=1961234 RepID=A0ABD3BEM9_9LAMI